MQPYTKYFYKDIQKGSESSAKEIIPLVLELTQPKSAIDIGCGSGEWLSIFKEYGVDDIWGVDEGWVNKKLLKVPQGRFISFDLKKPFKVDRRFDLVVSLEVAEHLPSECAETFVDTLVSLGSVILFSAAIPFSNGNTHINEQWPSYWVKLFYDRGYIMIDSLRKKIWENDNVEWWYAQNILMFIKQDCLENHPLLKKEYENGNKIPISIVHPKLFLEKVKRAQYLKNNMSLRQALLILPALTKRSLIRRIKLLLHQK